MVMLELSVAETDLLRETLESYRQTLVAEIARADSRQYRTYLREREEMVQRILAGVPPIPRMPEDGPIDRFAR